MTKISDQLNLVSDKWLEDARVVKPSLVPSQVYHYTDAAGLTGMLSNHEIWLTDYRFLNDKTEFVHTHDILNSVIKEISRKDRSEACKSFVSRIRSYQEIYDENGAFVFSLSENGDDLSQWRGYSHDGLGFNIGFDANELYRVSSPVDKQPYSFSKIEYNKDKQFNSLRMAFSEFLDIVSSKEATKKDIDTAGRKFEWMSRNRAALNKHESFEGELEWRIVAYSRKDGDEIMVRSSGLRLIPYVTVKPQEKGAKLPIKSIGIGPGFIEADIGDAVRMLALQHGYPDLQINFAKTPFRRL